MNSKHFLIWILYLTIKLKAIKAHSYYRISHHMHSSSPTSTDSSGCFKLNNRTGLSGCHLAYQTNITEEPWFPGSYLKVDLRGNYKVRKIVIWPSTKNATLSRGINIYASLSDSPINDRPFHAFDPAYNAADAYTAIASTPVWTRYVKLYKFRVKGEDMALSRLAVYTDFPYYGILTRPFVTTQNHIYENQTVFSADKATDGLIRTCAFTAQENVADRNISGWWRMGLDPSIVVKGVVVINGAYEYHVHIYRYFRYVSIYVHGGEEITDSSLCLNHDEVVYRDAEDPVLLFCSKGVSGSLLSVARNRASLGVVHRGDALAICEILVLADINITAEPPEAATSLNKEALIIGCVLGSILLIFLIIFLAIIVQRCRSRRNRQKPPSKVQSGENRPAEPSPYNDYTIHDNEAYDELKIIKSHDKGDERKNRRARNNKQKSKEDDRYVEPNNIFPN